MQKIGLTLGKFLPFHKGHELLIQIAAENVDGLVVLIGVDKDDPYSFEQRKEWVYEAVGLHKNVHVVEQKEYDKHVVKDAAGTVTDEAYWQDWIKSTQDILADLKIPKLTHIFTSDLYGERIAKEFNAKWIPVDPDREMQSISGTAIRDDFVSGFSFLPTYTKRDLVKTVSILGPESCGKSTLVQFLGKFYDVIPEYGRILSVNRKNDLTPEDFFIIAKTQQFLIEKLKNEAHSPVIVTDTEALITALYFAHWFHPMTKEHEDLYNALLKYAKNQKIDKYIVLAPTVPFVQDGYRVLDKQGEREMFFHAIIEKLAEWGKDYEVISSDQWHIRRAEAEHIIEQMIPKPKY